MLKPNTAANVSVRVQQIQKIPMRISSVFAAVVVSEAFKLRSEDS